MGEDILRKLAANSQADDVDDTVTVAPEPAPADRDGTRAIKPSRLGTGRTPSGSTPHPRRQALSRSRDGSPPTRPGRPDSVRAAQAVRGPVLRLRTGPLLVSLPR